MGGYSGTVYLQDTLMVMSLEAVSKLGRVEKCGGSSDTVRATRPLLN